MSQYEQVSYETEQGVAIITLNRSEALNAMSFQLSGELHDAVLQACNDSAIGCLVITGAGERAFSAGGDIHEQRDMDKNLAAQWANEADFTRYVIAGAKAEDAFPDFNKRKGRPLS